MAFMHPISISSFQAATQKSHASAVAQGNVVRAMSTSYGKSLYSIHRRSQTPSATNTKIYTIDNVGDINRCANFHCHRLDKGAPTHTWNITTLWLFSFDITFLKFFSPNLVTAERSVAQICVMAQPTRFDARTCLFGASLMNACIKGSRIPQNPQNFGTYGSFKPKRKRWITFERKEIDTRCQQTTNAKVWSLSACHAP
jgi:hypothetical protein